MVKRKPPRADYFNFDGVLLVRLASAYGLRELEGFRPILLDGDTCTLIDVRSTTSRKMVIDSGVEQLFLKQVPWYCNDDVNIRFSYSVQNQLRSSAVPVPSILLTKNGEPYVEIGGEKFTLSEYVPGSRYNGSTNQGLAAATTLATMHALPLSLPAEPTGDAFIDAADHIALAKELISEKQAHTQLNHLGSRLLEWRTAVRENGWNEISASAVHGDYNPWNLLFDGRSNVRAVLDFDNAHRGMAIRDIVELIITFASIKYRDDSTNFASRISTGLDVELTASLLAAYDAVRPLSVQEKACLTPALGAVAIELACLGLIRGDYTGQQSTALRAWIETCVEDLNALISMERGRTWHRDR